MFTVLHVADFALHAVLRTETAAAGQPAALFSGTGKRSVVLAATPAARAAGVEVGMSAPQAVARCARLLIRAPQPAAETEARAALLATGFTLSPAIEDTAPGVCTADVTGCDPTRRRVLAQAALAELARLGLPATAGIARTPLLALYAARSRPAPRIDAAASPFCVNEASSAAALLSPPPPEKTLAPISLRDVCPFPSTDRPSGNAARSRPRRVAPDAFAASSADEAMLAATAPVSPVAPLPDPHSPAAADSLSAPGSDQLAGPAGSLLVVTDEKNFLAPLPLAAADPAPELAGILHGWGLRTLGDLTALPRDEIVRRFGAVGLELWTRAAGGTPRPLHPVAAPREFSAAMELEHEIETLEPLLFILRRFLERLSLELRATQHVAAELELTLRLEDETAHARRFRLPEPTADVEILFRTLHTYLESLSTRASIAAVQLRLKPARPLVRQQGLFETGLRDPHGFAETLARVGVLVGADHIGTPQLEDTHRPDAVKLAVPAAVIPPPAEPPLHPPLGLPLRRFRPPLPARLEFTAGRPTYLWTEHVRGEIARQSQPWPANGDWWQHDRAWARTEWDIALAAGGLFRLLLVGDSYFVEGEYD